MDDEIVAEVHKVREELAARFKNDLRALTRFLKDKAVRNGRTFVSHSPRRILPTEADGQRQKDTPLPKQSAC